MKETKDYIFFWSEYLSQWYTSIFTENEINFSCCEQYMMYWKAKFFKDEDTAILILKAKTPREQKSLGRKVKNFNTEEWNKVCKLIVYNGNYLKFMQYTKLYDQLIQTFPKELVEASPYDRIWGIGLDETEAINIKKENWNGTNWLGEVLTKLRNDFMNNKAGEVYKNNFLLYTK